jgi:hypothetical protein
MWLAKKLKVGDVLSGGEVSLEDKLSEAGSKAKGDQKVRLIDTDAIVFDELGIFNA